MTLRCVLVLLVLGLCATLARAGAGKERDPLSSGDVVVGIVKAVSADEATNGNPARVTFEITETLKGQLKGTVVVLWQGPSHDVDYGTPAKNPIVIAWAALPAEKPEIGDAYILFGGLSSPRDKDAKESQWLYTRPGVRMPVTAENRDKALRAIKAYNDMAKAERDRQAALAAPHALIIVIIIALIIIGGLFPPRLTYRRCIAHSRSP